MFKKPTLQGQIGNMIFIINGEKTKNFWDGTVRSDKKPLRIKIRNICGDETVWEV